MQPSKNKTYVIMPHFIITEHVAQLARDAIKSFRDTSDCIIISCDDDSPYDTNFLKDISDVYIKNEKNLGFAGNCNVGFNYILDNERSDCNVVCVNNDIEVYSGWLEEFERTLDIIDARIIGGIGFREKGRFPDKVTARYLSTGGYLEDWMFPGGFYMVKKSVLEDYGLYDEGFKHGGYEDIDIFLRWKNGGERLVITPRVAYWHEEGATRFSDTEHQRQTLIEPQNREYYCKKNKREIDDNLLDFLKDDRVNL